jgi:Zn-finger nucleic acid-binding protein
MNCPTCKDVSLVMSERQGVEIDYCPSCRGVWLDRGELDKIIEKASEQNTPMSHSSHDPGYKKHYSQEHGKYSDHGKYKKKNWLSELFD